MLLRIPYGKLTLFYGKSPCSMGKSTISMVIFNSYGSNKIIHWPVASPHRGVASMKASNLEEMRPDFYGPLRSFSANRIGEIFWIWHDLTIQRFGFIWWAKWGFFSSNGMKQDLSNKYGDLTHKTFKTCDIEQQFSGFNRWCPWTEGGEQQTDWWLNDGGCDQEQVSVI